MWLMLLFFYGIVLYHMNEINSCITKRTMTYISQFTHINDKQMYGLTFHLWPIHFTSDRRRAQNHLRMESLG